MIDLAIRQALRSDCRHRVGAVLVVGRRVMAASPNLRRNDPMIDFRHATFHAEEAVLRRVRRTAGAVIYVARVGADGTTGLARPCPRCQESLAQAGISRAVFTTSPTAVDTMGLHGGTGRPVAAGPERRS
ncbi:hypothetical protein ACFQ71_42195 [Streptomyces sp. NPDC056534]|uniref:hypothetical protein n=1 Tax=Streptomyces sp. NPDC056534 TaxID=3345857 RepID=UPI0036C68704